MGDMDFSFDDKELKASLTKSIRVYPDLAADRLRTTARDFKKDVISETKAVTKKRSGNLIKGFKLDRMQGYNENMSIDFRGTAPHFHLIENGHAEITKDGKTIGFVPGKHIVKKLKEGYEDHVMPVVMSDLLDDIVKECGL